MCWGIRGRRQVYYVSHGGTVRGIAILFPQEKTILIRSKHKAFNDLCITLRLFCIVDADRIINKASKYTPGQTVTTGGGTIIQGDTTAGLGKGLKDRMNYKSNHTDTNISGISYLRGNHCTD